eukprot:gene10118-8003_t
MLYHGTAYRDVVTAEWRSRHFPDFVDCTWTGLTAKLEHVKEDIEGTDGRAYLAWLSFLGLF